MTTIGKSEGSSLLRSALQLGLGGAYRKIRVDPQKFLRQLQKAYRLPVQTYDDLFLLGPTVLSPLATRVIRGSARLGALDGLGFGLGGFLSMVPDMGVLATITIRLLQKLSLLYGFDYTTEDEELEFLLAAATAAGLDLGRDFLEKQATEKLVPRVMERVAARVGAEVAEDWAGKIVPVIGAGVAGTLNYYFVRSWGRRAQRHFEGRHWEVRSQLLREPAASADLWLGASSPSSTT